MLPFLKNKQEGSVSGPVDTVKREPDEDKDYEGMHPLEVAMEELFSAKSNKEKAEAFKAAIAIAQSEPHEEHNE